MFDDGSPIFLQLAERIRHEVLTGIYAEGDQLPSINELAAFHRINPATANRAVALLVEQGIVVKRRGIGMFVAEGAHQILTDHRRGRFTERFVQPLLEEARILGLGTEAVIDLIRKEAKP